METARHSHVVLGTQESGKFWDSRINICPGSTPTLAFSTHSLKEENVLEEESKPSSNHSSSEESDSLVDWSSDSSWPDVAIPGTWGTQALEEIPWENKKKPYTKFRKYEDLELNPVESEGVLTDRIIATSSSYLDKSPETGKYVLCKVILSDKHLTDISIMQFHHYLQYVDLSWNELTNVESLGQLPFLMYLNLSHNLLTKVLGFRAPFNLTYVNYSHNAIQGIDDLTNFWSIVHLDLSHNYIVVIEGLQKLQYLRHLNLSYNAIESVENLNNMKLLTLNLQHNKIATFEEGDDVGFKTLIDILRINLDYNQLNTLSLFEGITGIQSISIMHNSIEDLMEINHLRGLIFLTEVDFRGNSIVSLKFYFEVCVNTINYLYVLDGEVIDAEKKVLAKNSLDPSLYMQAIRKSSKIFFLQQINEPFLGPPIVPVDQPPPPIIILVGPPGSNKGKLNRTFCKQHERLTMLGVSHTTRGQNDEEVEGEAYYFIDGMAFRLMLRNGEFLTVSQTFGKYFGLAQSEIGKTVNQSSVLMLHMNISGALTLRTRGLRCQLVLAMPSTADVHRQWLLEKYYNWHDSTKFVGAVEVENCPEEAQHFLNECEKHLKMEETAMAEQIVSELVSDAIKSDGRDEFKENDRSVAYDKSIADDKSIAYDSSVQLCETDSESTIGSVKMSVASSRASGILKSPANRSKVDTSHIRISVTFQNERMEELYRADNIQSQTHLQPCRSVTFIDLHDIAQPQPSMTAVALAQPQSSMTAVALAQPQSSMTAVAQRSEQFQKLSKYSVSGTIVYGQEQGSTAALSALSSPKRDSAETHNIAWDIQTEAIKTAIEEIISTRDAHLDIHYSNPGLFTEVIFTDNLPESFHKLKQLLKKCIEKQATAKPNYQFPKDAVYQKMTTTRLESLHKEINSELSITQKQLDSMARRKTLKAQGKKSSPATAKPKPQVGFMDPDEGRFDTNELLDESPRLQSTSI